MQNSQSSTHSIVDKFNLKQIGNGDTTLVFAHGFGCDQQIWNKIIPLFENDFKLVLFDYIGSGKDTRGPYDHQRYLSLDSYAEDVIEILDSLELRHCFFIGHSVSGAIGMLASIQRPDLFAKLITIAPSPRYINDGDYFGGFDQSDVDELLQMMHLNYFD